MMNVKDYILQLIRVRSSTRLFDPSQKLEQGEKDLLLRCVDHGPSAGGLFAYGVYYTEDETEKRILKDCSADQQQVVDAPIVFCIAADSDKSSEKYGDRGVLYAIQDATIAGMNLTFAATALGLGTCWIGSIDPVKVRAMMKIPANEMPISLICVGYPLKNEIQKERDNQQAPAETGQRVFSANQGQGEV